MELKVSDRQVQAVAVVDLPSDARRSNYRPASTGEFYQRRAKENSWVILAQAPTFGFLNQTKRQHTLVHSQVGLEGYCAGAFRQRTTPMVSTGEVVITTGPRRTSFSPVVGS